MNMAYGRESQSAFGSPTIHTAIAAMLEAIFIFDENLGRLSYLLRNLCDREGSATNFSLRG